MSCQRFSFRDPGTFVCANSSTSATCGLRASRSVDVHLLERPAAVFDTPARHNFEVADLTPPSSLCRGLHEADGDVLAVFASATTFVLASSRSCRRPAAAPR